MSEKIKALLEQRVKLVADSRKILEKAEAEKRPLNAAEEENWAKVNADIDGLKDQADRLAALEKHEAELDVSRGRETRGDDPAKVEPAAKPGEDLRLTFGPTDRFGRVVNKRELRIKAGSDFHKRASPEYATGFAEYIGHGRISAGLQTSSDPKGGYLSPTVLSAQVIKFLDDDVFMRQICNVLPPLDRAVSLGAPSLDTDPGDDDWTAEVPAADIAEDDAMTFGKRELTPHLMTKLVKISQKLIRSAVIDIESYVASRLAYKAGITAEKAYITGSGAQQPLGVMVASALGISTGRDVTASGAAGLGTTFTADDLINLMGFVKSQYQRNGSWLMHREGVTTVRRFKATGTSMYLWQAGTAGGFAGPMPDTILGRPVYSSEYVQGWTGTAYTTGQYVVLFGDFRAGYRIVDSLGMEVQRLGELFALKNQIGLLGRMESDGMPVLEEAFARLKIS